MSVSVEFDQSSRLPELHGKSFGFPTVLQRLWRKQRSVHHYQACAVSADFAFEQSAEHPQEFYMTAEKSGVKQGDTVAIHNASGAMLYTILEIDYFSKWSDMWMAKLALTTAP